MRRAPLVAALVLLAYTAPTGGRPAPIEALAPVDVVASGFHDPRGVAADGEGNVFVSETARGVVTRIDAGGRRTVVARGLRRPAGLALDPAGGLLIAEERAGRVLRLERGGRLAVVASGLSAPRWMAAADDGTLYVSASGRPGDRRHHGHPGDVIVRVSPAGETTVLASGFRDITGLAAAREAVHVLDGDVVRVPVLPDGSAGAQERVPLPPRLRDARGLALDRLGAVYVGGREPDGHGDDPHGDRGHRGRGVLVKLHPGGAVTLFAWALGSPGALAFDPAGNLHATEDGPGRVLRFEAPPAPRLDPPPAFTAAPAITVSGTAQAGARVDAFATPGEAPSTTIAAETGAFSLPVPLTEGRAHAIDVLATAHGGEGLTSQPATAAITRDGAAPSVAIEAPPSGAFVAGQVAVRVVARDGVSGVAAVTVVAGRSALPAAASPPLPAVATTASAAWNVAGVADGAHSIVATAVDGAGNVATAQRSVIVDGAPPDTTVTGPSLLREGASATYEVAGTDALTPPESLAFAWRLDGGEWSPFSSSRTIVLAAPAPGPHRLEVRARDLAGNEDPTPAVLDLVVSRLAVAVTEPAAGAVVAPGLMLVRGTVQPDSPVVAVSVNGFPALVAGGAWAVEIPTDPGDLVLSAVATMGAERAAATVTVTVSGETPALSLRASPESGLAPLRVAWEIANLTGRALVGLELDPTGGGRFGPAVTRVEDLATVYASPGLFFPVLRATDDLGRVHLARTVVHVEAGRASTARFQALWSDFRSKLAAGDTAGALAHVASALLPRLQAIFQRLGPDLAAVAAGLGDLKVVDQQGSLAETVVVGEEQGGPALYFVYFRRDSLGRWLIEEM